MNLPKITHLQFQVMGILMGRERRGQSIRDELRAQGVKKSGPGFYQLMARMEDAGYVSGWYQQKVVDGQIIKERWYKLTASGARAWQQTRDFYSMQAGLLRQGGLAHG